jgi:hypothetical protein
MTSLYRETLFTYLQSSLDYTRVAKLVQTFCSLEETWQFTIQMSTKALVVGKTFQLIMMMMMMRTV